MRESPTKHLKSQSVTSSLVILLQRIERRILSIRGQRIMLSTDLAELYEVAPKVLMQAVKPNLERFPADFMFQLDIRRAIQDRLRRDSRVDEASRKAKTADWIWRSWMRVVIDPTSLRDMGRPDSDLGHLPICDSKLEKSVPELSARSEGRRKFFS